MTQHGLITRKNFVADASLFFFQRSLPNGWKTFLLPKIAEIVVTKLYEAI